MTNLTKMEKVETMTQFFSFFLVDMGYRRETETYRNKMREFQAVIADITYEAFLTDKNLLPKSPASPSPPPSPSSYSGDDEDSNDNGGGGAKDWDFVMMMKTPKQSKNNDKDNKIEPEPAKRARLEV